MANFYRYLRQFNTPEWGEDDNIAPISPCDLPLVGTKKTYLESTYLFSSSVVLTEATFENGIVKLLFDSTVFHPQGGGQPSDKGFAYSEDGVIEIAINMVKEDRVRGVVEHSGVFVRGVFDDLHMGAVMSLNVDESWRRECARLHSGGHLLDVAMRDIGFSSLKPTKGYHFPDGN